MECLMAAGVKRSKQSGADCTLDQLQLFIEEQKTWLFGHLSYDLKNEIEFILSKI